MTKIAGSRSTTKCHGSATLETRIMVWYEHKLKIELKPQKYVSNKKISEGTDVIEKRMKRKEREEKF
jgi:hypothetical protein